MEEADKPRFKLKDILSFQLLMPTRNREYCNCVFFLFQSKNRIFY
jgi:hypothetical protein